jgi:hypothetical protein
VKSITDSDTPCQSHISNIKSFLPVEAEISVMKVFIMANMKNSKSHCKPGKGRHGTSHHAKDYLAIFD